MEKWVLKNYVIIVIMIFPAALPGGNDFAIIALDAGDKSYCQIDYNNPDKLYFYLIPPQILQRFNT